MRSAVAAWCFVWLLVAALLLDTNDAIASAKKATPTPTPTMEATPVPIATETPAPSVEATSAPETTAASAASSDSAATAVPVPSPSPVPIHSAQAGSSIFRLMDNIVCPQNVSDKVYAFYAKNKALFATCMDKSGYQIFPYSGKVPTADDITLMVHTPECMGVITAVAMANLPACSIGDMPIKAVVETLLKISVDMANGSAAPSAIEFHALMAWRRDVNLAYQAGLPYDGDSELYGIFKKALWKALANTKVKVLSDLTIVLDSTTQTFADSTGSTVSETVAKVQVRDASGSAGVMEQVLTPSATELTTTKSSLAAPRVIASSMMLAVVSSLILVAL
ncbi:Elicitin, partial [Globisporangium splendens]